MYLSSFRMGDHPDRLVELAGGPGPAAVIANAMDWAPDDVRRQCVELELAALAGLGMEAEELDLRDYFGPRDRLSVDLARYRLVWLRGGNVFVLRCALARSGADGLLTELLAQDAVVYAGYSAGPCVLGPSLRGLETVDDPDVVLATYGVEPVWEGMDLLPYTIVPHHRSPGHPETDALGLVADRYRAAGVPHVAIRDGQAIVIDGETTTIC